MHIRTWLLFKPKPININIYIQRTHVGKYENFLKFVFILKYYFIVLANTVKKKLYIYINYL